MATVYYIPEVGERVEIDRAYIGNSEVLVVKVFYKNGASVRGAAMSVRRDSEGDHKWLTRVIALVERDIAEREADDADNSARGMAS